ncbi:MAG: tetratricopeptide repeat protein [Armatimonadetes bacterium]|nr:tetratricopeptide repeat protein [Armatimonadota bacterium]
MPNDEALGEAKASAASRPSVELLVRRRERELRLRVASGRMGISAHPRLPAAAETLYQAARAAQTEDGTEEELAKLEAALRAAEEPGDVAAAAWLEGAVAGCLTRLGNSAADRGDPAAAEALHRRALATFERLAPASLEVAVSLGNLGVVSYVRGDLAAAEANFRRALAIFELQAPDSLNVAHIMNGLGNVASHRGDLAAAEAFHQRALAIRERLAPDSLELASSLGNLGVVSSERGDLAAAEGNFNRALAIQERREPDSLGVAASFTGLGNVASDRGDLAAAEADYLRALAIQQRLAPDSLAVATGLNNLGNVAFARGDLAAAEAFDKRALAIRERLAPDSLDVAISLHNLGNVAADRGDLAAAEAYYQRALAIFERLAPGSLQVAASLNNMGKFGYARRDLVAAEAYHQRALAMRQRLAPDSLAIAMSLDSLGAILYDRGDLAEAEAFLRRALAIRERLAPDSLAVATSLSSLSLVHAAKDRLQEAMPGFDQAMTAEQHQLRSSFPTLTEREKQAFLDTLRCGFRFVLSLAALRPEEPHFVRTACDWVLRRKGILLSAMLEDRRAQRLLTDEATAADWRELQAARAWLSHLVVAGPGKQPLDAYRKRCDELTARIEDLLKQLAGKSAAVRAQRLTDEADAEKICKALPAGAAVVEIVAYQPVNFKAQGDEPGWGATRYVAFVLRAGEPQPIMLDLGEAEPIDRGVARLRARLSTTRQRPDDGGLYDLLWSKLEPRLGGAKRVYLSPDGQLNLLAFGALQDRDGKYLAETYTFVYLASGRDLLRPPAEPKAPQWMVVSNPDFGGDPGAAGAGQRAVVQGAERSSLAGANITSLPGTKEEGEQIAVLARAAGGSVEELAGPAATEAKVKAAVRPAVLHLATHGFFLADMQIQSGPDQGRFIFVPSREGPRAGASWSGNPMQRSGLLLAGAARSLRGDQAAGEDGILTAEEVVGMDLEGTRLVCLSACETGLGEVKQGEGVMGLRRAFQMAGAESLVMSLWRVPDAETRDLMIDFYRRFTAGESAPDAMTAAQRAFIAARRAAKQSDAPFWWAGFVVGGR